MTKLRFQSYTVRPAATPVSPELVWELAGLAYYHGSNITVPIGQFATKGEAEQIRDAIIG